MKVGGPPAPLPSFLSPAQRRTQESGDQDPAEGFDTLLDALKRAQVISPAPDETGGVNDMRSGAAGPGTGHSPASPGYDEEPEVLTALPLESRPVANTGAQLLHPKIGSPSHSFEEARLLMETSLDAPRRPFPGRDLPVEAPVRLVDQLSDRIREILERASSGAHFPVSNEKTRVWSQALVPVQPAQEAISGDGEEATEIAQTTAAAEFSRPAAGAPRVQNDIARASAKSPEPQIVPLAETSSGEQPAGEEPDVSKIHASANAGASAEGGGIQGHQSPFAVQLLAAEGGLKLWVRLPRLDERERTELETRLAILLESFGHRGHELTIQEIAKA